MKKSEKVKLITLFILTFCLALSLIRVYFDFYPDKLKTCKDYITKYLHRTEYEREEQRLFVKQFSEPLVTDWRLRVENCVYPLKEKPYGLITPLGNAKTLFYIKPSSENIAMCIKMHILLAPFSSRAELAVGRIPWIWPDAESISVYRGENGNGKYIEILNIEKNTITRKINSVKEELIDSATRTKTFSYFFYFIDRPPQIWKRYFYKIKIFNKTRNCVAESGYVSAIYIPNLKAKVFTDKSERFFISWKNIPVPTEYSEFIRKPAIFIDMNKYGMLGPFKPDRRKAVGLPFKSSDSENITIPVTIIIKAPFFQYSWGLKQGIRKNESSRKKMYSSKLVFNTLKNQYKKKLKPQENVLLSVPSTESNGDISFGETLGIKITLPSMSSFASGTKIFFASLPPETIYGSGILPIPTDKDLYKGISFIYGAGIARSLNFHLTLQHQHKDKKNSITSPNYSYVNAKDTSKDNQSSPITISFLKPPQPSGLKAISEDKQVRLQWEPLNYNKDHWIEKPLFIVKRYSASDVTVQDNGKIYFLSQGEEIFRAPVNVRSYIDKNVKNGKIYFYTLEIEGMTKNILWHKDYGNFISCFDVHTGIPPGFTGYPVIAVPGKKYFLNVTLINDIFSPSADELAQKISRKIAASPLFRLIERTQISTLYKEIEIQPFSQKFSTSSYRMLTDVIIRITSHPYKKDICDIWLEDIKNGTRQRITTCSLNTNTKDSAAVKKILSFVTAYSRPFLSARGKNKKYRKLNDSGNKKHDITVALLHLRCDSEGSKLPDSLTEDKLCAIFNAALSTQNMIQVVERIDINKIFQESSIKEAYAKEEFKKVIPLISADIYICGSYSVKGDILRLYLKFVSPHTGIIMGVKTFSGKLDNIDNIAAQVGKSILKNFIPNFNYSYGNNLKVLAAIEASFMSMKFDDYRFRRFRGNNLYIQRVRHSQPVNSAGEIYISDKAIESYYRLGRKYIAEGQRELALQPLLKGLENAEKAGEDPERFYTLISEIMKQENMYAERIKFIKRAIAFYDRRIKGRIRPVRKKLMRQLIETYLLLGDTKEAKEVLNRIKYKDPSLTKFYIIFGWKKELAKEFLYEMSMGATTAAREKACTYFFHLLFLNKALGGIPEKHFASDGKHYLTTTELMKMFISNQRVCELWPLQTIKILEWLKNHGQADSNDLHYLQELRQLYAKQSNPDLRWTSIHRKIINMAPIVGNKVYMVKKGGFLCCYDINSHSLQWSISVFPPVPDAYQSLRYLNKGIKILKNGNILCLLPSCGVLATVSPYTKKAIRQFVAWTPIHDTHNIEINNNDTAIVGDVCGGVWKYSLSTKKVLELNLNKSRSLFCKGNHRIKPYPSKNLPSKSVNIYNNTVIPHFFRTGALAKKRKNSSELIIRKTLHILCNTVIPNLENKEIRIIKEKLKRTDISDSKNLISLVVRLHNAYVKSYLLSTPSDNITRVYNRLGNYKLTKLVETIKKLLASLDTSVVVPVLIGLLPEQYTHSGWKLFVYKDKIPRRISTFDNFSETDILIVKVLEHITGQSFGKNKGQWEIWYHKQNHR